MKLLLMAMMFVFQTVLAQTGTTIHFKEIGWTITLPPEYKIVDTLSESSDKNNTTRAVNMIYAEKDNFCGFNARYIVSPKISKANWEIADSTIKYKVINSAGKDLPRKGDVVNSMVTYDGVVFKCVSVVFDDLGKPVGFTCLSSFYKEFYFLITYGFGNNDSENEIIHMLKTSKFDK
jgi:hypothetical protein